MQNQAYQRITDRIVATMEQGRIPWRKPWKGRKCLPRNFVSSKEYRGINVFLLLAMDYESPLWLTMRQVNKLGGNVRKGERACPVVFWKRIKVDEKEGEKTRHIPILRYYHVFNVSQCVGLPGLGEDPGDEAVIPGPEEIVTKMPERPPIKHGMDKAFYAPMLDLVGMPDRGVFERIEDYYSTLFHELTHSTGHPKRLNRPSVAEHSEYGTDPYCKEELVAEMGAAFLCGSAGIVDRTIDNSAAYLSNWLERLRSDAALVVQAASQAQKAADFILGQSWDETPEPEVVP